MGYSVIEAERNIIRVRAIDVLKLSSKMDHYERLQLIHEKITSIAQEHQPEAFAIEAPFFGKNVQSMLKLGRAQGVAIAAAMSFGIPVTEYSPKKVKQAITGSGNADKEQVWKMLRTLTSFPDKPKYFDATDALAVAICHHFGSHMVVPAASIPTKKKAAATRNASWEKFVKENGHRVK
jgi:crossover junction endodeoxyribonuclease RuvC